MTSKRPPFLQSGDKVALIATAKKIEPAQLDGAIREMQNWHLGVVCGSHLYASDRQFAGTDDQRRADLQWALDAPEIKAVIFARGGYGTARLLDDIDWSTFAKSPKWLCGFSDLTALHQHVWHQFHIETLHSTMPIFFKDGVPNMGSETLRKALFGLTNEVVWDSHAGNRPGQVKGPVIGGNLSVLCSIAGSASAGSMKGGILFLEDLCEHYYHLDRMMLQLKRAGTLSEISGLIVGQFTDMIDNPVPFGRTSEEIICEAVAELDIPVALGAPIGHVAHNEAVRHGGVAELVVPAADGSVTLTYVA